MGEVLSLLTCNRIVSSVAQDLERFHKEMRRKQRDIGMFQSEPGCEVALYLLLRREVAKQQARLQSRL